MYNHSNKGYELGGSWMVVQNNINYRDRYDKTDVYNSGLTSFYGTNHENGRIFTSASADDLRARAFTVSSNQAWYHKNQWKNTGSIFDNSGEGILHQDHLKGSECYGAALTYNKGNSYQGVWNGFAIGHFVGWAEVTSGIHVKLFKSANADLSGVNINNFTTGSRYNMSTLTVDPDLRDYYYWDCPSFDTTPGTPTINVKDTADFVLIRWSNVKHEAGYRVDKRKVGNPNWTPIAYRPRQETTGWVTFAQGPSDSGYVYHPGGHGKDAWDGKNET